MTTTEHRPTDTARVDRSARAAPDSSDAWEHRVALHDPAAYERREVAAFPLCDERPEPTWCS